MDSLKPGIYRKPAKRGKNSEKTRPAGPGSYLDVRKRRRGNHWYECHRSFCFSLYLGPGGIFGLSIAEATLVCYVGLSVAGGIGLLQGKDWGRILGIVNAALSLFGFPIGTTIGILILIYLLKPEIREYFECSR